MAIAIEVQDKKAVTVTYDDGRKVRYLYNHFLSENPDRLSEGYQLPLIPEEKTLVPGRLG